MDPGQIQRWLDGNLWKFDGPEAFLGDEPGSVRKPWDRAQVRMLLAASWPYMQAAGNNSVPVVYRSVNDFGPALCDRYYLPATPRDFRLLERGGLPVFGTESKHSVRDFDVLATSISYTVLWVNFCNTGEAPVWMADGTFKPISKVQVGDEVMGWEWRGGRRRMRASRVQANAVRRAKVVKVTLESGRVIRCTPDHKWLSTGTGNSPNQTDSWTTVGGVNPAYEYRERKGAGKTSHLGTLYDVVAPPVELTAEQQREADWLAGIFDGEGSVGVGCMRIAQSLTHNPEVCARIERALTVLGIPYAVRVQANGGRLYDLKGGRQTVVNWLNWTNGVRRRKLIAGVHGGRLNGRGDRVVKIEPDGEDAVYSMQTETGNYVAWGFASKNCNYLRVSGIPLRWRDREHPEDYPMVMVGGQAFCAPEFMAPVVDCVFLGEAEDEPGNPGIQQVMGTIMEFKQVGDWQTRREWCYRELAKEFGFLYFPRYTEVGYKYEDRGLPEPTKMVSWFGAPGWLPNGAKFKSRRVKDIDAIPPYTEAPLLYSDPGMGAGDIEAARGCPAWCSFCRLSWVTKPYREHSVDYLANQAAEWRRNMGSNELSPYGPDFPMYTRKKELLGRLLESVSDEVDTGAMRVDDFTTDPDYSMLLAFGGTDAVTLGLEGNSQRMRDLVGKGVSDKDVEAAVERAIRAGIKKVKLFMISNMPGEESGDVMRIVRLARRLAEIREQMGVQGVRIQLSWTPLLIEAQTPMQWFAPTAPDYTLQQAMAELRELHVEMKLGSKAQPEKIALFQACQRASRDAGEAITDVIEDLGQGCWGGVAKDMKDRLDAALTRWGFRNGLADLYGERFKDDLFGWEHIDTGVPKKFMWDAYQKMVRFLERTDAESYDGKFDQSYHGAEWIPRCDQHCSGNACGCCDKGDLLIRQNYIKATDRDLGARPVQPLDQTTVTAKVRFSYDRGEQHRYVSNAHWKFAIRRAAYRAQERADFPAIAKRSVRIVSDAYKFRDRSAGIDYAEFGVTRPFHSEHAMDAFMNCLAGELAPWLDVRQWALYPADSKLPATPTSLWELELDGGEEDLAAALRAYDGSDYVKVLLRQESFYSGMSAEEVNAKDHISDAWLARDCDRLLLRMILNGKLGPYQAYAPLCGKKSWVGAMKYTARRIAFFDGADLRQGSLLRPVCIGCGWAVPVGLLGELLDTDYCPRCRDEAERTAVTGLSRAV